MRSFRDIEDAHDGVLRELTREKAGALSRIGGRLGTLVAELEARRLRWSPDPGPEERTAYRELREEALLYRWYLEVQREAVGVRGHARLDELYPIPGALDP